MLIPIIDLSSLTPDTVTQRIRDAAELAWQTYGAECGESRDVWVLAFCMAAEAMLEGLRVRGVDSRS